MSHDFEVEFRWKEQVIYWEGHCGSVFEGGWGVDPVVTVVPDASTWDQVVPDWLRGRRDEVCERLRSQPGLCFTKSETILLSHTGSRR